jgi:hypothetical protein
VPPALRVSIVAFAITLAASCSARTTEEPRVRAVAVTFYKALAEQDGVAACAVLAPETFRELEKSAKQPCDRAVTDQDLPDALGNVNETKVHGNEGRVAAEGDTVFVSDFGGTWKIVAVGCSSRGDLPYDCEIEAA